MIDTGGTLCHCCGQPMPFLTQSDLLTALETWVASKGYTMAQIKSPSHDVELVAVRRWLARYMRARGLSYPEIGRFLDRNHTTVMNLVNNTPRQPRHSGETP